jgi:hypothetical protein
MIIVECVPAWLFDLKQAGVFWCDVAGKELFHNRHPYSFVSSRSPATRSCNSLALLMRYSNSRPL